MKIFTQIPLWFKIIFVIATLGFIYMISINSYTEYQYKYNSITTKAEVLDIEREEYESDGFPGKSNETLTFITYEFLDINYKKHKNKDIVVAGQLYKISIDKKAILIRYLKDNPSENRIVKSEGSAILVK